MAEADDCLLLPAIEKPTGFCVSTCECYHPTTNLTLNDLTESFVFRSGVRKDYHVPYAVAQRYTAPGLPETAAVE